MFPFGFDKLLLIGVIAVVIIGPKRLPTYAAKLAQLVRRVRSMADGAREKMREEMGPEFDDIDWKKLDPRQYDPRRIIRDALLDEPETPSHLSAPLSVHPGDDGAAQGAIGAAGVAARSRELAAADSSSGDAPAVPIASTANTVGTVGAAAVAHAVTGTDSDEGASSYSTYAPTPYDTEAT